MLYIAIAVTVTVTVTVIDINWLKINQYKPPLMAENH